MLNAISYDFIQNAIMAGIIVSIIAGIIGSLVVVNQWLSILEFPSF